MDTHGHNHLPSDAMPHDHGHGHDHGDKPRWLPFLLGLLVILVAALALLNRERLVAIANHALDSDEATEQPAPAPAAPAAAVAVDPAPAVKPIAKPKPAVSTKPIAKTASAPAPTGLHLAAAASADGVSLNWTASSIANFAGYKIVRSADNPNLSYPSDGYVHFNADRASVSYLDAGATPGRSYYYRICAVDTDGKATCGNVVETIGD